MKLFTPIVINRLELKNRIVMSAMHLGYTGDRQVTERLIRFYEERAKGGAALLVIGGTGIDEHGYFNMPSVADDKYIVGLRELTGRLHKYDARVACQLFQAGRYAFSAISGVPSVSASAVKSPLTNEVPREMSIEEVQAMIKTFGQAARRVREAGFDLVEVIGSAGYLVSQFLSPATNLRTDEFGGSLENRMRFGLEVVREIRRQVGEEFPISMRFAGHELIRGGTDRDEIITFAKKLEEAGADMLNVTGGWHESPVPQTTMDVPLGAFVYMARRIKEAVTIPVVASNRINDPLIAEQVLVNHQADLISMARGLLADPELPRKAQEGRFDEIRKCIGCNQGCMDHVFEGRIVECLVNAQGGHECEIEEKPAENKKRILIIGGGPAGMETARVAAWRGHDVTLWEKSDRLGGQLPLAAAAPGRSDFNYLDEYLQNSLIINKVRVELNKEAGVNNIKEFAPDAVVIATGAGPMNLPVPGADRPNVVQAWDLLQDSRIETGNNIVVVGAGAVGCESALTLSRIGTIDAETLQFLTVHKVESPEVLYELSTRGSKRITLVEQQAKIGVDIGRSTKWVISMDLPRFGVEVLTGARVMEIADEGVVVEIDGTRKVIPADTVILAVGSQPHNELQEQLKDLVPEIHLIGDGLKPRKAMDAIHEGYHLGNEI